MKASDIPNLITMMRLLLVVPVVWLLFSEEYGWALILFGVAGFSDGLDGYLAKHYGWSSRLGSLLDPLADKLLLVSCFLVLGAQRLIPWWLVGIVILRDIVIITGALLYHFQVERLARGEPSLASKLNTLAQILLVVGVLFHYGFRALPQEFLVALVWAVTLTVIWSGAGYLWTWGRRAARVLQKRANDEF